MKKQRKKKYVWWSLKIKLGEILLPRKSAAFLPLLNLPVGFLVGKSTPLWGKSALAIERGRWLLLPTSTNESPNTNTAGTIWASEKLNNKLVRACRTQKKKIILELEEAEAMAIAESSKPKLLLPTSLSWKCEAPRGGFYRR